MTIDLVMDFGDLPGGEMRIPQPPFDWRRI
jgi:hypothetical protein